MTSGDDLTAFECEACSGIKVLQAQKTAVLQERDEARILTKWIPLEVVGKEGEMDVAHFECPDQPVEREIMLAETGMDQRGGVGRDIPFAGNGPQYIEHFVGFPDTAGFGGDVAA